jgi:hypothetical protein
LLARAITCDITILSKRRKLFDAIRNNPKDVGFDDACKVAELLGFTGKSSRGSHHAFARPGERQGLNFQRKTSGNIPAYQARQLIEMIDKYGEESGEADDT